MESYLRLEVAVITSHGQTLCYLNELCIGSAVRLVKTTQGERSVFMPDKCDTALKRD